MLFLLYDPIWDMSSRSDEANCIAALPLHAHYTCAHSCHANELIHWFIFEHVVFVIIASISLKTVLC